MSTNPQRNRTQRLWHAAPLRSLVIVLVIASGCLPESQTSTSAPRIEFAKVEQRFARVDQGAPIHHEFAFSNRGGGPLLIERLRTGCHCQATARSERILPGSDATIVVDCNTAESFGPQRYTVSVYTNDPAHPAALLSLNGEVALAGAADPSRLYVGSVQRSRTAIQQTEVVVGEGVQISSVSASNPYYSVVTSDLPAPLRGKRVGIVIAADAPLGPFDAPVHVRTSSPRRKQFDIPVVGAVVADAP